MAGSGGVNIAVIAVAQSAYHRKCCVSIHGIKYTADASLITPTE